MSIVCFLINVTSSRIRIHQICQLVVLFRFLEALQEWNAFPSSNVYDSAEHSSNIISLKCCEFLRFVYFEVFVTHVGIQYQSLKSFFWTRKPMVSLLHIMLTWHEKELDLLPCVSHVISAVTFYNRKLTLAFCFLLLLEHSVCSVFSLLWW